MRCLDFNANKDGFVDMGHPSNKSEKNVTGYSDFVSTGSVNKSSSENNDGFVNFLNIGGSGNSVSGEGMDILKGKLMLIFKN